MRVFTAAMAAIVVTLVSAQEASVSVTSSASLSSASASVSGSSNATNATSTATGPVTHTVAVGKAGNTFSPDVTLAEPGDTVLFQFYPTNHSVIRAAYGYPCVPYELVEAASDGEGFFSGFKPVDAILDEPPSWSLLINDTNPVFYYCGAPGSCISYGMVGVINPNASTSLVHQRQLAESSTFMLEPGQEWPNEASVPSGVANTAVASTSTPTPTATHTAAPVSKSNGLGGGAIAGIAIGSAAVLLAAGVAIWFCGRASRKTPHLSAPAQEILPGGAMGQNQFQKHMSTVSGFSVIPGYGIPSPGLAHTPTVVSGPDGQMILQEHMLAQGSPHMSYQPAPAYGQPHISAMYSPIASAPGTATGPVEMAASTAAPTAEAPARRSTDKGGVERYS